MSPIMHLAHMDRTEEQKKTTCLMLPFDYHNHAPNIEHNVSRKKNGPKNPWISSAIIKSIRKKHTLYKKYKSSNFNEEYGNKYKKYRNTLVTVIKNAKRLYYCNSFNYNKNDMR